MTTNSEILNYASSLTDTFVTVPTNEWGSQCIVLVDKIVQHFTDKNLSYTNAIDALKKAKSNGFVVEMDGPNKAPKAGAFYVIDTSSQGNPYGHIGMATQDSDGTEIIGLEANVDGFVDANKDGVNDQYQVGGPVRKVVRDWYADGSLYIAGTNYRIGKVIGWFYLPTEGGSSMPVGAKSIDHNGDVYSSLTTHFNENIMYSNLSAGVSGYNRAKIDKIVIHHNATTNKNVAMSTWYEANGNWTSAHYEIADNEIWGCVGEQYCAFHSGDADMNMRSIGLEHLNATGAPSWTISEATYKSSAKLIADICKRYGLKPDSNTIIPHKQVSSTACPGGIDMARLIKMAQDEYNGKTAATQKQAPKETEKVASNEQTSARLLVFDEDLNGYKKGDYLLLNFDRGTYSKVNNKAEVDFIKKQYTGIQIEHVSKGYPAHVRYIQGFKLNKI